MPIVQFVTQVDRSDSVVVFIAIKHAFSFASFNVRIAVAEIFHHLSQPIVLFVDRVNGFFVSQVEISGDVQVQTFQSKVLF
ncbi:hypothetical protein D3C85_1529160 [compost metagenome]